MEELDVLGRISENVTEIAPTYAERHELVDSLELAAAVEEPLGIERLGLGMRHGVHVHALDVCQRVEVFGDAVAAKRRRLHRPVRHRRRDGRQDA